MIYIFDIDGTLADLTHRLHHIQKTPKDWAGFFQDCENDSVIEDVAILLRNLSHHYIILVTGRSDEIREKTEVWLKKNNLPYNALYMRKAGDHREDNVVKSELLDQITTPSLIGGIFEDRQQVVDMYRARGLRVFQVAPGNF